jgi:hypothetical protein
MEPTNTNTMVTKETTTTTTTTTTTIGETVQDFTVEEETKVVIETGDFTNLSKSEIINLLYLVKIIYPPKLKTVSEFREFA